MWLSLSKAVGREVPALAVEALQAEGCGSQEWG